MGTVTRTTIVVAALFWLSVAPSFGQTAASSPSPCASKNCSGNAALSGLSGGALAKCKKTVIAACTAGTCTCGTSGTCNGATLCATTTTTTTATTTSSTTTTTLLSLKYTTAPGTTSCGGPALSSPPTAPFSGEIDSDTGCMTKISDLGSSCLYIGGGGNSVVPGGATPAGASSYLDIDPITPGKLNASNGTGMLDCTKGSGPANECVNAGTCTTGPNIGATCFNATSCSSGCTGTMIPAPCCTGVNTGSCACAGPNPHKSCTSDADCASIADSCQPTANCFFGPPLAIPNPSIANASSCNINVVKTDASGTGNPTTGDATVDIPLQTRVYLTGNQGSPCPQCNCGTPPCSGTGATGCTYGPNAGGACSTSSTTGNPATGNTSQDCPPEEGGGLFNGALTVTLNPLTTGSQSITNISGTGSGNFCSGQGTNGAFGQPGTQCITETGMAAGDLTDGAPHAAREGAVFCIPATANGTVNVLVDLPGPGATSLPGIAQIVPTP